MAKDTRKLAHLLLETTPAVMGAVTSQVRLGKRTRFHNHFRILWLLSHEDCSMSELAHRHGVSVPSMSSTAQTLVERGWIDRVRSKQDRRIVNLRTSRKGREILVAERERMLSWLAEHLQELKPAELEDLERGLLALRRLFEPGVIAKKETAHDA